MCPGTATGDVQRQRDREAQREIDMRRDMYDLAAQWSRAAALEAELKCLKANIGPPTVAYEVPAQLDDIAPPEVTTAVQISPLWPVMPIDNLAVQGLAANITQRQDIANALTWNSFVEDANPYAADNCRGAGITSQPSFLSSATNEPTVCRTSSSYTQPQLSDPVPAHMPVRAFPRELPQPSNPGYMHQSDAFSRRPLHTFPRSLPELACTQSTMTSMLSCQPACMPTRTPTLVGPPSREDVVTSALPHPPIVPVDDVLISALPRPPSAPADFAYNTMHRPADGVVDGRNVYTHSVEPLAHLPPPPPVNRQSVPLLPDRTQATARVNQDPVPVLTAHRYANTPFDSNYQNISPNLSLPTHTNVPSSQAVALGQSNITQPSALYAASYADHIQPQPIAVDPAVQYTVGTSVVTSIAPLQSPPSVHWRKQLAYDYVQPDTCSRYMQPPPSTLDISDHRFLTHTHTHTLK